MGEHYMKELLKDKLFIGLLALIVIFSVLAKIAREELKSKYDYSIRSSLGKFWVNQNEIEQKGDILIIHHEDGKTSVLTSYQIEDNRNK